MEPRLSWKEVFSVGHATLDAEHRRLIEYINQIWARLDAGEDFKERTQDLYALTRVAKEHFDRESGILREILVGETTPDAQDVAASAIREHIGSHEAALNELASIVADIRKSLPEDCGKSCDALVRWFVNHSINYDAHLKSVFQAL